MPKQKSTPALMAVKGVVQRILKDDDPNVIVGPDQLAQSRPHLPTGHPHLDYLIGGKPNSLGVAPCPGFPRGAITSLYEGQFDSSFVQGPPLGLGPDQPEHWFEAQVEPLADIVIRADLGGFQAALGTADFSQPRVVFWVMDPAMKLNYPHLDNAKLSVLLPNLTAWLHQKGHTLLVLMTLDQARHDGLKFYSALRLHYNRGQIRVHKSKVSPSQGRTLTLATSHEPADVKPPAFEDDDDLSVLDHI